MFSITHNPELVLPILEEDVGVRGFMGQLFGLTKDSKVVVAAGFESYNGSNVVVSLVIRTKFIPRLFWWALGDYCFNVLGCVRVTAVIDESNEKSIQITEHIGFVKEATLKQAGTGGQDSIVYVLWKENYKWLGVREHG